MSNNCLTLTYSDIRYYSSWHVLCSRHLEFSPAALRAAMYIAVHTSNFRRRRPDTTHHRNFSATVCVHAAVVLSSGRVGVRGREAQGSLPLTDCEVCAVWRSSPTAPCFAGPAPRLPALPIHAWPAPAAFGSLVPWVPAVDSPLGRP